MPKPAVSRKPDPIERHPDHSCNDDEWQRKVNPIDPRNIDHPLHDEKGLALMRELGRIAAAQEWERLHGNGGKK